MMDPPVADLAEQVSDLKSGAADPTTAANIVWSLTFRRDCSPVLTT
jgi:hypothetical protein